MLDSRTPTLRMHSVLNKVSATEKRGTWRSRAGACEGASEVCRHARDGARHAFKNGEEASQRIDVSHEDITGDVRWDVCGLSMAQGARMMRYC